MIFSSIMGILFQERGAGHHTSVVVLLLEDVDDKNLDKQKIHYEMCRDFDGSFYIMCSLILLMNY
ncbi:unnamed protein product [Amoebophrya sp. A25]|nr:unnamed protein product [Amoebophrya sp. A25]|eukprot:GSA25T00011322001.1